jgi:hypothetical protein
LAQLKYRRILSCFLLAGWLMLAASRTSRKRGGGWDQASYRCLFFLLQMKQESNKNTGWDKWGSEAVTSHCCWVLGVVCGHRVQSCIPGSGEQSAVWSLWVFSLLLNMLWNVLQKY